jgi:Cu(I)/Ag(I) efflux system membrane fusion protein
MTAFSLTPARLAAGAVAIAALAGVAGYGLATLRKQPTASSAPAAAPARTVLYWYDPMVPDQHFDKPGKSPMGMDMIPRYADGGGAATPGVAIDPTAIQNLGVRLASVQRSEFADEVLSTGVVDFNQRDVAIVQARAAGFVQRTYARAPGDVVRAGAPLADLLIPTWGGAQAEYLAVRAGGDPSLERAARQRLLLLGMTDSLIDQVARSGRPHAVITVTTPVGGAIQTLDVRPGMTVAMGQTLAQVAGLSSVWVNAAAPEAQGGQVRVGASARAEFAAFPGQIFSGRVTAVLPTAQADSRTLTVRVELANRDGRLKPGMFAAVHIGGGAHAALTVPSEAVIRTGRRAIVMLAAEGGRFQPVEVRLGREDGDRSEILSGLDEGQKIVASGQFLIDSEASLAGLQVKPLSPPKPPGPSVRRLAPAGAAQ